MSNDPDRLNTVRAIWDSVFGKADISHYPRLRDESGEYADKLDSVIVQQITAELRLVNLSKSDSAALDIVLERANTSLKEVKDLTEYQDQKASRLLTIITFFSALAGALFTRFATAYPFGTYLYGPCLNVRATMVILGYASFSAFVLLALCGALVLFYATRTRFKWPSVAQGESGTDTPKVKSRLFYEGILAVTPTVWARQFIRTDNGDRVLISTAAAELKLAYAKDYILESYLVAAKVADKLRYMTPGQDLLFYSLKALLLWILLLSLASIVIP